MVTFCKFAQALVFILERKKRHSFDLFLFYLFVYIQCYIVLCMRLPFTLFMIAIFWNENIFLSKEIALICSSLRKKKKWNVPLCVCVCVQKQNVHKKIWNIKRNVMVEHSMQKLHIRQINDKECAPFHTAYAMHTYTQNKAYHILWFVYDVPWYFIVGCFCCCCLPLVQCMYSKWLSPLLLCNRFVSIHNAFFCFCFLELVFISLFIERCIKITRRGFSKKKRRNLRKIFMQSITVNVFVSISEDKWSGVQYFCHFF